MKEYGFTLVELLGTIVILGMIVLIAIPSVNRSMNNSKSKLSTIQIENLKDAAKVYFLNEGMASEIDSTNYSHCVNVSYLIENDYIDDSELSSLKSDKEEFGSIRINYDNRKYKYIYTEDSCESASVCKLVENGDVAPTGISIGDKYQCKVKDDMEEGFEEGYYFYVLGTNNDGTINLIMERNIYYDSTNDVGKVATSTNPGLVAWYASTSDHSYGPVDAMNYLHNATKDWNNVPNMIMNYEDENLDYGTQQKRTNGYGSIKTTGSITIITSKSNVETGRIENLKARMPRYDEVHGKGKCLTYEENGNNNGSCPLWLSNYMNSSYVTGEGLQNIRGIYGYWTLSSYEDIYYFAWRVDTGGCLLVNGVTNDDNYGVRPVITLPENRF